MSRRVQIQEMLNEEPNDPFLNYALAQELLKEGLIEEGEAQLRTICTQQPDYVPAWFRLGQFLADEQRTDEAVSILQEGIATAKRTGDLHAASEMTQLLDLLT